MQSRLRSAALLAVVVIMLAGCSAKPFAVASAPGRSVQDVLISYANGPKSIVDYNLSSRVGVGSNSEAVTDPKAWVVVASCETSKSIVLGVVRFVDYSESVRSGVRHHRYEALLRPECA